MSGIPDSAILELTFNCNHSCLFCYAPWLEEPSLYGRELSIPEWIEVAELLIRRGVRRFTLSGGELLLKEGGTKLIDFLAAHPERPHFTLYTNGSLVTRELVERLRGTRGDFAFSLPGIRCYRALTGSTWSVDGLIDLFDLCRNRGVPFGVGIVVTRPALREWKQLISLAVLSGAATVQIGPFLAEGRGRFHPELLLTCREAVRLGEEVRRFSRKCPVPLRFAGELFCSCRSDAACIRPPGVPEDYRPAPCSVEERFLVVGPAGKCRRCLHLPEEAGDVRRFAGMAN